MIYVCTLNIRCLIDNFMEKLGKCNFSLVLAQYLCPQFNDKWLYPRKSALLIQCLYKYLAAYAWWVGCSLFSCFSSFLAAQWWSVLRWFCQALGPQPLRSVLSTGGRPEARAGPLPLCHAVLQRLRRLQLCWTHCQRWRAWFPFFICPFCLHFTAHNVRITG